MIRVNLISETVFSVKGHGVHTAYLEMKKALDDISGVKIRVNSFRSADITHIHTVGLYSLMHLLVGRGKKVVNAHVIPDSFVGSLVGAKYWYKLAFWYLKFFYNRADLVLPVSNQTSEYLKAKMHIEEAKIEVVYNAVNTAEFKFDAKRRKAMRKKLGIDDDQRLVISVGQIQPRKRFDLFVRAAKALRDVQFIWVGGMPFGRLASDFQKYNRQLDNLPENLSVTGVLKLHDARSYYQAADMFVLLSDQETFGTVVVEAAASGLPIILRDIPDFKQTFADYSLNVTERDYIRQIMELCESQKSIKKYSAVAKKIAKRYDNATQAKQLRALYRNLIRE